MAIELHNMNTTDIPQRSRNISISTLTTTEVRIFTGRVEFAYQLITRNFNSMSK